MTQDPGAGNGLSNERVAELEHKLADAAAEVAKVQAQLAQAQQPPAPVGAPTSTTPPSTGIPGSTIPPVPYAGTEPHVITIDGQQVAAGSGQLAAALQKFVPGGPNAGAVAPVVMVNGQQVSGGTPIDLSAYLTPAVTQQLQSSLAQLGLDNSLGAMFGHAAPPAAPEYVAPLAEPPRHVPFSYRIATFNLVGSELFLLVIGFAAPMAVWIFAPQVFPAALVAAVLVIAFFRGRTYL